MTKYVELKTAIDAVNDVYYDTPDINLSADKLEAALRGIPSVDVAPVVHGHWIDNGANGYKWAFICSRCGYVDGHPFDDRHNFCPSCGAIMDGGKNDAVD